LRALAFVFLVPVLAAAAPRTQKVRTGVHKVRRVAPKVRPEENQKLGGAAKAFAKARVEFDAPADRSEIAPGDLTVRLTIAGYALVGGAHAHLIVDDLPALQMNDVSQPHTLSGLPPGPHVLRAVLCRPWHEVVKARRAFAMTRFWSGERTPGRAGRVAEQQAWPNPRRPLLTYVLPIGEWPANAPEIALSVAQDPKPPSKPAEWVAEAPVDQWQPPPSLSSMTSTSATTAPTTSNPTTSNPTSAQRRRDPALDFYLSDARLGPRGYKIRVVLDRAELQLIKAWRPRKLTRLRPGNHYISIDLLDRKAMKVREIFNRTDRRFRTP
jgi:hypothetical protein